MAGGRGVPGPGPADPGRTGSWSRARTATAGKSGSGYLPRRDPRAPGPVGALCLAGRGQPRPLLHRSGPHAACPRRTCSSAAPPTPASSGSRSSTAPSPRSSASRWTSAAGSTAPWTAWPPASIVLAELETWPNLLELAQPPQHPGRHRQWPADREGLPSIQPHPPAGPADVPCPDPGLCPGRRDRRPLRGPWRTRPTASASCRR